MTHVDRALEWVASGAAGGIIAMLAMIFNRGRIEERREQQRISLSKSLDECADRVGDIEREVESIRLKQAACETLLSSVASSVSDIDKSSKEQRDLIMKLVARQ